MSGAAGGLSKGGGCEGEDEACTLCGATGKLQQCSKCHSVRYCGPECQRKDWKEGHKAECAELARGYAADKVASSRQRNIQGRFEGAGLELERALSVQRELKGVERDVGTNLLVAGDLLRQQGKYPEALEKLEEAIWIFQKQLEGESVPAKRMIHRWGISLVLDVIGFVKGEQGKYDEALEKLQESLRIAVGVQGPEGAGEAVATRLNSIGCVYLKQEKRLEALGSFKEALRMIQKNHGNVSSTLSNIGSVYLQQGKPSKALKRFEEALRIDRTTFGKDHPRIAASIRSIGGMYHQQGRHPEALAALDEALRIQKKMLGGEHPDVAGTLGDIAEMHADQGKLSEALGGYEEALRILKKALGEQHPEVARTLEDMAEVRRRRGLS